MAVIGYARVSSVGQSVDIQMEKLQAYGVDKIFSEKLSGTTANRLELKACLEYVRDGDILVITKLDRLARSTLHLHKIVNDLSNRGVGFKVLDQAIDTTTKEGRLLFSILASLAEFETEIRAERTNEGRIAAMDRGVQFGAKPKLNEIQIAEMKQKRTQGVMIKDLMSEYHISKASVYRLLQAAA